MKAIYERKEAAEACEYASDLEQLTGIRVASYQLADEIEMVRIRQDEQAYRVALDLASAPALRAVS